MEQLETVYWTPLNRAAVKVGDLVSADAGGLPIYKVLDVMDDQALLAANDDDPAMRVPLAVLHWRAVPETRSGAGAP